MPLQSVLIADSDERTASRLSTLAAELNLRARRIPLDPSKAWQLVDAKPDILLLVARAPLDQLVSFLKRLRHVEKERKSDSLPVVLVMPSGGVDGEALSQLAGVTAVANVPQSIDDLHAVLKPYVTLPMSAADRRVLEDLSADLPECSEDIDLAIAQMRKVH